MTMRGTTPLSEFFRGMLPMLAVPVEIVRDDACGIAREAASSAHPAVNHVVRRRHRKKYHYKRSHTCFMDRWGDPSCNVCLSSPPIPQRWNGDPILSASSETAASTDLQQQQQQQECLSLPWDHDDSHHQDSFLMSMTNTNEELLGVVESPRMPQRRTSFFLSTPVPPNIMTPAAC